MNYWIIAVVAGVGAVGGFANVFAGDAGFHLPQTEDGVWQPGYLGVVIIGAISALASWASLKTLLLIGSGAGPLSFSTGDLANALIIGFGGAKWLKSEAEKNILRKTASIAASKPGNAGAAAQIASGTPLEALRAAIRMSS
ncbi:MAG: hypothetical protein ACYCO5_00520 [Acidobacteriaceae bacterium]